MEYAEVLGYKMSCLMLGTAQFGMNYGIANKAGQPSKAEVQKILSTAFYGGINALDTAYAYGEGEEILGEMLWNYPKRNEIITATKLAPIEISPEIEENAIRQKVEESLFTSLRRLRLDSVQIYMLHRAHHITFCKGAIIDHLVRLKERGLIKHIGVSIYTTEEANLALSTEGIDVIQIPFNVFDQRLKRAGFLSRAKSKKVAVLARSVFLQGIILMDIKDVPKHLQEIIPFKKKLSHICDKAKRTIKEVALKFPLTQEGISSIVVGVDNAIQMEEDLVIFDRPPLSIATVNEIQECFHDIHEYLVNPSLWTR